MGVSAKGKFLAGACSGQTGESAPERLGARRRSKGRAWLWAGLLSSGIDLLTDFLQRPRLGGAYRAGSRN